MGLVKVKEEPTEVLSCQGIQWGGSREIGSVRIKEEQMALEEDWKQERGAVGLSTVKQEYGTNQSREPGRTGAVICEVKEEESTKQDECQVAEVTCPLEDTMMDEAQRFADAAIADFENLDSLREGNEHEGTSNGDEGVVGGLGESLADSTITGIENVDHLPQGSGEEGTVGGCGGLRGDATIVDVEDVSVVPQGNEEVWAVGGSGQLHANATIEGLENVDLSRQGKEEEGADGVSCALAGGLTPSTEGCKEVESEDLLKGCNGLPVEESSAMVVQPPQYVAQYAELGGLLKDGVLSSNGLAKIGMVLRDESSSEEESACSEEEDDAESAESSDESSDDSSSEEEEDMKEIKEKIRKSCDETKEDAEPPRTKNEVSALPPVPKVETVLKPHHVCVSTGVISSVVERYIIVEGKDDSKVLTDGSILWLTDSRLPLGIVDEVFGPVKKPYYCLRFNEVSDIHESAKVGADVAYVAEFAEFVLKDNPNLFKKAVDASGLDDEELSDAEIEFSDDEKEMAAKQREKGKRGCDSKENGGQAWDSSEPHPPVVKGRWQKRERGRGRGYSQGGPQMTEGVGSAMADMDLHGPGSRVGMSHRGTTRARPGAGSSKFERNPRHSNARGWDGQDSGATYSRLHDALSRGDWVPSPTRHSPGAGPSANGAYHQSHVLRRDERRDGPWYSEQVDLADRQPHQANGSYHQSHVLRRDERRDGPSDGPWYSEQVDLVDRQPHQANGSYHQSHVLRRDERRDGPSDGPWYSEQVDLTDRQPHQAVGGQGLPSFGVAPLHRHLQVPGAESRLQVGSGYSAFGYSSVATPQIATDGQGNFFHITGPVNLPPDATNVGRMGMNVGPTLVSFLPPTSPNSYSPYNSPGQVRQGRYENVHHSDVSHGGQHGGSMGPSPGYSNRMVAPEFRFQAMPSDSPNSAPGGTRGPHGSGYVRAAPPHVHGQRYQGSRGR